MACRAIASRSARTAVLSPSSGPRRAAARFAEECLRDTQLAFERSRSLGDPRFERRIGFLQRRSRRRRPRIAARCGSRLQSDWRQSTYRSRS